MGKKGKTGKNRLDKYYHLAKEQGYRSRAAFKLIQLNKKYNFLEKAKVLIDLCAAPGGWLQVASKYMPIKSLILGVDLVHIKPIPRCITFAEDITTDKCRAALRGDMKTWKADVVLHDGAPNVGAAWAQDAFSQSELVLSSLKLAVEFLAEGGTFVTKIFRSKDYNSLMWVFSQLFKHVEATKPPSSRTVSAEIFVVCRHFLAPKKVDPKFLDPRFVFKELEETVQTSMESVFRPDKHRRNREGYNDGETTLFHVVSAHTFVHAVDAVNILATKNQITFTSADDAQLRDHPDTHKEICACCEDLKVLGRRDFRLLIRWRKAMREHLGLEKKESPESDEQTGASGNSEENEEEAMLAELDKLAEEAALRAKRLKRKVREKRAKQALKLQLNMTTPTDICLEERDDRDSMFSMKSVEKDATKNGMNTSTIRKSNMGIVADDIDVFNTDEMQLQDHELSYANMGGYDSDVTGSSIMSDDDNSNLDPYRHYNNGMDDRPPILSGKAAVFFDNPLFHSVLNEEEDEEKDDSDASFSDTASETMDEVVKLEKLDNKRKRTPEDSEHKAPAAKQHKIVDEDTLKAEDYDSDVRSFVEESSDSESGVEEGHTYHDVEVDVTGAPTNGLITAEALTLAHKLVKNKSRVIDASYNRYTFTDADQLPKWFLEDENKYNKPIMPITKEAVLAVKERLKALDARPIKKVAEAKFRKKKRALAAAERLVKKAAVIAETDDMTESTKAQSIVKLMGKKLSKNNKQKNKPKLVVAKNNNRGIQGRPKGVKGKYKMVDGRMKKEVRALKRIEKKHAPKRRK